MKISKETVERKYQELIKETDQVRAIQELTHAFGAKAVTTWLTAKSAKLPMEGQDNG